MDCSLPGSSVHGIFQVRILVFFWGSFPHGSDSKEFACNARDSGSVPGLGSDWSEHTSRTPVKPRSPAFQVDSLPSEPPGSFTISFIILVYYDISLTINFNVAYLILKFRWVCLLAYIYILTCIICSDLRPDFTIKGEQKDILILTLPNQKLCFKTSLCKFIKLLKPREALYGFIEHQHKLNSNELIFIEWSLLWLQLLRTCTAGYWLQHRTVIC